jgi:hypothetical protein
MGKRSRLYSTITLKKNKKNKRTRKCTCEWENGKAKKSRERRRKNNEGVSDSGDREDYVGFRNKKGLMLVLDVPAELGSWEVRNVQTKKKKKAWETAKDHRYLRRGEIKRHVNTSI